MGTDRIMVRDGQHCMLEQMPILIIPGFLIAVLLAFLTWMSTPDLTSPGLAAFFSLTCSPPHPGGTTRQHR